MASSAGGYSTVTAERGSVRVHLGADHPGFHDEAYRARRDAIAALALQRRPGDPVARVDYTDEEHEIWRIVSTQLERRHRRHAAAEYLAAKGRLALPGDRIPQLDEVTAALTPLTGFRFLPVAGLAPLRQFFSAFAERSFLSTQYIRHPSSPLYTPEPDAIHEVIGHANQLASPVFADLCEEVGRAVGRTQSDAALGFLANVFWFTLEFGVVWEGGDLKAYGAGILSSDAELTEYRRAEVRPVDFVAMGTAVYDITRFQPVLYAGDSFPALVDTLRAFYGGYDDDAYGRLVAPLAARH